MVMEPSSAKSRVAQASPARTLAIAVTAAMAAWLGAAACAAAVSNAGDTILAVGTALFDASWMLCALCAAPWTPKRWTVLGEMAREALHMPHLLALEGVGAAEAMTGQGDPVRIAGWLLCAAAFVNLALEVRRGSRHGELSGVATNGAVPADRGRPQTTTIQRSAHRRRHVRLHFHVDFTFGLSGESEADERSSC